MGRRKDRKAIDRALAPRRHSQHPSHSAVMNRYPLWKYVLIAVALGVGLLYTLPNFFPEVPAVQVSTSKATIKVDAARSRPSRAR